MAARFQLYLTGVITYMRFRYGFYTMFFRTIGFPVLEMLTYGFLLHHYAPEALEEAIIVYALVSILFRIQYSIGTEFIAARDRGEILYNFASPLTLPSWFAYTTTVGFIHSLITFASLIFTALFVFDVNVFSAGLAIIPVYLVTIFFGVSLGLIVMSIILLRGYSADMLAWALPAAIFVVTGTLIPTQALPGALQIVARLTPTSSTYDFLRTAIGGHYSFTDPKLFLGLAVAFIWLLASSVLLKTALKVFQNRAKISSFA